ncbi:hypothetical protein LI177_05205 [bacterium 210820-DFI.6.37]|nr:hypothetical protein [bacterium 210820-DFI.6.37]
MTILERIKKHDRLHKYLINAGIESEYEDSAGWHIIKRTNGIAIAWKKQDYTCAINIRTNDYIYRTDLQKIVLPAGLYTEVPYVFLDKNAGSNILTQGALTKDYCGFYIRDFASVASFTAGIFALVIGKWK